MTNTKQEWEERFDKQFHVEGVRIHCSVKPIKNFITAEKEASYQERNEEIKRIINAIDIYKETHQKTPHLMYLGAIQSDLKSLLQSLPIKKE